jgi:hypothetical protein
MSKEKVYLPEWVLPMAEEHAHAYCEDVLGLKKSNPVDKNYEKAFDKEFQKFCEEFYEHSLIPHASNPLKQSNPTVSPYQSVFDFYYAEFASAISPVESEQLSKNYKNICNGISLITNVVMESEMGKMKYDIKDIVGGDKEDDTAKRHEAVSNRFKRLLFASILMSLTKSLFKLKKGDVESLIKDLYKDKKWRSMQSKSEIKDFLDKIKKGVEQDPKSYVPLDSIKKDFKK